MATLVREARLILTDISKNNNKFWNIALYDDGDCETRWGRVGEDGQSKRFPGAGEPFFDGKCREKRGKGYHEQKTLGPAPTCKSLQGERLAEVAGRQIETNSPETLALVAALARANVHNILQSTTLSYDTERGTFSTPLGIVTKDAIDDARRLLAELGALVVADRYDGPDFTTALNDYLMLVPQNVGRGRPDPRRLYPDVEAVQKQSGILDSLEASLQMVLSAPRTGAAPEPPKLFEARLHAVTDAREIDRIRARYRATNQALHACHHLDVRRVFSVEIGSMRRAFEASGRAVGNVKELWHGTKASNLLSILKSGFFIPPTGAPYVTGRMFGNGVYFSDQSTKSLNYAYGYWDGRREETCYMFLCDVAMGREFVPSGPSPNLPAPDSDSTYARAGKSGVMNNEMIVYKTSQINPRFLVEFGPRK